MIFPPLLSLPYFFPPPFFFREVFSSLQSFPLLFTSSCLFKYMYLHIYILYIFLYLFLTSFSQNLYYFYPLFSGSFPLLFLLSLITFPFNSILYSFFSLTSFINLSLLIHSRSQYILFLSYFFFILPHLSFP